MPCPYMLMDSRERMMTATDKPDQTTSKVTTSTYLHVTASNEVNTEGEGNISSSLLPPIVVPPPPLDESLVTRSAFEITSVSHVPPEENEDGQTHASKDQDDLQKSLLEAGNRHSNCLSTSSAESEVEFPSASVADPLHDDKLVSTKTDTNTFPKPPDIAMTTNGPAQLIQSRFRRVNQYVRGRWLVRDMLEPEGERPESEMKMAPNRPIFENAISPSINRKQQNASSSLDRYHDNESDDLNYLPQPMAGLAESIHSLSRTGSMSSVRELCPQEDVESTGSIPLSVVTPDIHTTLNLLDRPSQRCDCDDCNG